MSDKEKVKKIIAETFEVSLEEMPENPSQKNMSEWDSLRHLNLIIELEAGFDMCFEPEEISKMNDLDSVIEQINIKLHEK